MLAKENRLRRRRDFDTLFKTGKSVGAHELVLKYSKSEADQPTRLAFIISAKTEKSAVKRNRAKRQMREVARPLIKQLTPGYDAAFIVRKAFIEKSFAEKEKLMAKLLNKAKLLK